MSLKSIMETISMELIAETIGAVFFIGLMVWLFFSGGAQQLFEAWGVSVCG